jgi:outer membrane protein
MPAAVGCDWIKAIGKDINLEFFVINMKALAAVAVLGLATAQTWAADKVAVFNFERAILGTEAAKKASSELSANPEFAALQATYEGLIADMEKLREEQVTEGMTWNTEQQAEHRKKVEYVRADIELAQKKLQAEQAAAVRSLLQEYEGKTREILNSIIQAEGITVVLAAQNAMYFDPASDLTLKVTAELNKLN